MARSRHSIRTIETINPYLVTSSTFRTGGTNSLEDQQQAAHCPICLMKFKEPRRLHCNHTFCRTCLNSVFEQQQAERGENYCLICQQPVEVPPLGVDALDSVIFVYSLKGILPRIREDSGSLVKCSKCNRNRCLSCIRVICNKCERYFATKICTACQTYMCGRCAQDHSTAQAGHGTISIKEDVENKEREIHNARVAEMNSGGLIVQQTLHEQEDEEPDEGYEDRSSTRDSANENEQMNPTRLNRIVNETVHVQFGEEQIEMIAPRNQRRPARSSTASIEADMYGDGLTLPKSCFELGGLKICTKLVAGLIAVLLLSAIVFGLLVLVAILPTLHGTSSWIYPGEAVQVASVQPFWALEATVDSDLPYNNSFQYLSSLGYYKCSEIPTVSSTVMVNHTGIQDRNPQNLSVFLPTATNGNPLYLLPGSQMNFSILLYAETAYKLCASNLILYSNYEDYIQENSLNTALVHCVEHATSPQGSPATFSYIVSHPGFYFAVLSIPPLTSYTARISTEHVTYNLPTNAVTNSTNSCQLQFTEATRRQECTITLTEDPIVASDAHYCIVAVTTPFLSDTAPSYVKLTVSTSPNIFRNVAYILMVVPMLVYFPICFFLFFVCKCIKHCSRQCHNKSKTREISTI